MGPHRGKIDTERYPKRYPRRKPAQPILVKSAVGLARPAGLEPATSCLEGNASFSVLDAADHGYRPVKGEKLLQVHEGLSRMEWKSTGQYSYGAASVSIPIAKGMRLRMGGGNVARGRVFQATDRGRLLVTGKALVFEGRERNERLTWGQVAEVEICKNGYVIHRRRGKPMTFTWGKAKPEVCAVIDMMLRRVA